MQPQMGAILDAPRLTVAERASRAGLGPCPISWLGEGRAEALQLRSGGTLARARPSIYR